MKISLFFCLVLTGSFLFSSAQAIQNEVIASSGDSFRNSAVELSWTIGECIVETENVSGWTISQGFHQPFFKFSEIGETAMEDFNVVLFPNPTTGKVKLKVQAARPGTTYQLSITDFQGKNLLRKEITLDDEYVIDLSLYTPQLMFLKIIRESDHSVRTFKIVHLNQ